MGKLIFGLILVFAAFGGGVWFASSPYAAFNIDRPVHTSTQSETEILSLISRLSQAWNAGNIDAFMADYWKSENLRFASAGTVSKGWQETFDRYAARYPDKVAMGQLEFTELEVNVLSPTDALVFGRWTLTRQSDTPTGLVTFHIKLLAGNWKIVSDHTSSEIL